MPFTKKDYPVSLKNFMAPVRNKAIDIANALLDQGYEEDRAIAIATSQAEEWAGNRNIKIRKDHAPAPKNRSSQPAGGKGSRTATPSRSKAKN